MSGQRRALLTMMPLSVEKLSTGKPAICQSRIITGLPRVASSVNPSVHGIPF